MCQNHYHFHKQQSIPLDATDFDQIENRGWAAGPRPTKSTRIGSDKSPRFPSNGVRFGQPAGALMVEGIGKITDNYVRVYLG